MIRRILVPTDHSPSANGAVALAADVAGQYDARLTILHVGFRGGEAPAALMRAAEQAFAQAKAGGEPVSEHPEWSPHHQMLEVVGQSVLAEARALAERHGAHEIETVLDFGDDAERILHHARSRAIDMIVMGTRGHSELQGLLLGSVSNKIQHLAPCTTVLVRQPADARVADDHTILAATDGSEHARKACQLAADMAVKAGARLIFLHLPLKDATPEQIETLVDTKTLSARARDDLRLGSLPLPIIAATTLEEVGRAILAKARAAAEAKGVAEVETIFEAGDPAHVILELAKARRVDLIVMGSRGVGMIEGMLLGSASNKVGHLAQCPVVAVR